MKKEELMMCNSAERNKSVNHNIKYVDRRKRSVKKYFQTCK